MQESKYAYTQFREIEPPDITCRGNTTQEIFRSGVRFEISNSVDEKRNGIHNRVKSTAVYCWVSHVFPKV